jgi:hypothetical protein
MAVRPFTQETQRSAYTLAASLARLSSAQSIPNNAPTAVVWDTTAYDFGHFYNSAVSTTRLTVPRSGYYALTGYARFATNVNSNRVQLTQATNGIGLLVVDLPSSANVAPGACLATQLFLNRGDYVELFVLQNNTAAAAVNLNLASFTLHRFA